MSDLIREIRISFLCNDHYILTIKDRTETRAVHMSEIHLTTEDMLRLSKELLGCGLELKVRDDI